MPLTVRLLEKHRIDEVIPLLILAEPQEDALRWGLAHLSDALYVAEDEGGSVVGSVSVRWRGDPAAIEELAVTPERQGRGFGREIVRWVAEEARRRAKRALVVGTPNASIGNIAFYQRCGFRMDRVRKDYFSYYEEYYGFTRMENGIEVRDLLMFRLEL
jgi:GNAT superfamily N-acetyltransferase